MSNVTIAVDTAKNVFEIAISAAAGRISERRRMTSHQFERFWSDRPPCQVVMEACGSSHYWGRRLRALGFARESGLASVYLTTFRGLDAAAALYARAGFTVTDETSPVDTMALGAEWTHVRTGTHVPPDG